MRNHDFKPSFRTIFSEKRCFLRFRSHIAKATEEQNEEKKYDDLIWTWSEISDQVQIKSYCQKI